MTGPSSNAQKTPTTASASIPPSTRTILPTWPTCSAERPIPATTSPPCPITSSWSASSKPLPAPPKKAGAYPCKKRSSPTKCLFFPQAKKSYLSDSPTCPSLTTILTAVAHKTIDRKAPRGHPHSTILYPDPCRLGCPGVTSAAVLVGFLLIDAQPLHVIKDHGRTKPGLRMTQRHVAQLQTTHMTHVKPPGR